MKKIKRIMIAALAVMLIVACAITMTACGKEVTLTATYASPPNLGYTNMRPANNYYMTTFSCQTLGTYSDNTYCLIQTSTMFSGLVLPDDSQNIQAGSGRTTSVKNITERSPQRSAILTRTYLKLCFLSLRVI